MLPISKHCLALVAALILGGCGIGSLWGDEEEPETEVETSPAVQRKVPVQSIGKLEIGRTRDGILITALGTAQSLGYSLPTLRVRRDGRPGGDGFIEYDFVANEPAPELEFPVGTTRTRALRADLPVRVDELRGVRGIRVWSATNAMQIDFAAGAREEG